MGYKKWANELKNNFEETVEWRRHLHANPEPSFQEKQTATFIAGKLNEFHIKDVHTNVGNGYGIVAKISGSTPGPTIAFRADIDALKLQEESDVAFRSKNPGVMHACGHDAHTAALLSVAKILQKHSDELKGNIVLLFQNAEEQFPGGAESMVENGCLEGVDFIFGAHVISNIEVGKIGYLGKYGSACTDTFNIRIQGKGGHGAMPHTSIDPIIIGSYIVAELQTLISRYVDPMKPAVLTFAGFQAGGEAENIIPDSAVLRGTVRTLDFDVRDLIETKIKEMSAAIANSFGGYVEVVYRRGYPSVINTTDESQRLKRVMISKFGEKDVFKAPTSMGGEDFAYYLQKKPGAFFNVGAGNKKVDAIYPHHHPKFKIDEQSLLRCGEAFLALTEDYLL